MESKRIKFLGHFNSFQLALGLAVLLLAATALIFVNFTQLTSVERNKVLPPSIYRDLQEVLAISEAQMNERAYSMVEEARKLFPLPDALAVEKEKKLDLILAKSPWLVHVFLFDEKDLILRTQPGLMGDRYVRDEHENLAKSYPLWLGSKEGKSLIKNINKKPSGILFDSSQTKRSDGPAFLLSAFFTFPTDSNIRVVIAGTSFDPDYLKNTFFPEMLEESISQTRLDQSANPLAMAIYPLNWSEGREIKPLAGSVRWGEGRPEVTLKLDEVFHGLTIGIRFQRTSVETTNKPWVYRGLLICGILLLLITVSLVLTKHLVSKAS
jgi:hypothetical protein